MTPAIDLLNQHKIQFKIHQYQHDSKSESYGYEAAEKLGVDINRVFKTLVLETDQKQLVVAVISVNDKLNLKKLAKACCVKKIIMADRQTVQKSTGYIVRR
jgi:Cys-tRNA(Pro)/Cys-tRNA(Cys) deacylase